MMLRLRLTPLLLHFSNFNFLMLALGQYCLRIMNMYVEHVSSRCAAGEAWFAVVGRVLCVLHLQQLCAI